MEHFIRQEMLEEFRKKLWEEEKSGATVEKYIRDLEAFYRFMGEGGNVTKEVMISYKEYITGKYAPSSVNSMLAAVNTFLRRMGWHECTVKALKIQKEAFRSQKKELTKEEYYNLLEAAKRKGNMRLYLMMETLCATGIRISELRCITVEAVRAGYATACSKGKRRTILLPSVLCRKLRKYVKEQQKKEGMIFVTRSGNAVDRSNIVHDMKKLCEEAGVPREKIFPHNLRHLFATTYYRKKKDITHLADLLGHSNINTTRIYTLESGEEHARQINVLGLVI